MLSIFGLVLLLLLSPCKVRNFVQSELGIPQTIVLNKSQTTIAQSSCQTFELVETVELVSEPTVQKANLLSLETSRFDVSSYVEKHSFNLTSARGQQVSDVPLYILYQHLKVYS